MKGQYSKFEKSYVDKYFPNDEKHRLIGNRMIIDKSPYWYKYWKERGVDIPAGSEVWSIASEDEETLCPFLTPSLG